MKLVSLCIIINFYQAQCSILRRHFLELTQSFMIPLERYLSSLMPLRKEMSPFKAMPTTRPFSMEDFLATIGDAGPGLTCGVKGDWAGMQLIKYSSIKTISGLYQRFITSSNFAGWFSHRTRDVNRQLKVHYVDVLCSADLGLVVLPTFYHSVQVPQFYLVNTKWKLWILFFDIENIFKMMIFLVTNRNNQ